MNTPEQKGTTLARDMIALVESHYPLNDERMVAMNGMMGAFLYLDEYVHSKTYADEPKKSVALFNAFSSVYYPYMRECFKHIRTERGSKKADA